MTQSQNVEATFKDIITGKKTLQGMTFDTSDAGPDYYLSLDNAFDAVGNPRNGNHWERFRTVINRLIKEKVTLTKDAAKQIISRYANYAQNSAELSAADIETLRALIREYKRQNIGSDLSEICASEPTFQYNIIIIDGPGNILKNMTFPAGPDYYLSLDNAFRKVAPNARDGNCWENFRTAINTLIEKKVPLTETAASRIISHYDYAQDFAVLPDDDKKILKALIIEYQSQHGRAGLLKIGATEERLSALEIAPLPPADNPTNAPTPTPTNVPTNAPTPKPEQQSFWDKKFLGLSVRAWAWILGGLLVGGLAYGAFRKGGWLNKDKKKTASVSSTTPKTTLPPYNEELGMAHLRTATQSHTSSTNSNPLVNSGTVVTPERPFRTTALLGANEKSNS